MDSDQNVPTGLVSRVTELQQALFVRDHETVAELYSGLLHQEPDFLLKEPIQYEVGRLLEHNGHLLPAHEAYKRVIEHQPRNKMYDSALRGAGRTAFRLGRYDESSGYLRRYVDTNPRGEGVREAQEMLANLSAVDGSEANTAGLAPSAETDVQFPADTSKLQNHADSSSSGFETPQARADRLRDGQFALILPTGVRIRLAAVAQVAAGFLGVGEAEAKKLLLRQKGLVLDELTFTQASALIPLVRNSGQRLQFVCVPRHLRPYEHYEILRGELHDKGIHLLTTSFDKKLRWSAIRLINCGSIRNEPIVTVHGSSPIREYRFMGSSFDSNSVLPGADAAFHLDVREFLDLLCRRAPKAVQSHTVQQIVQRRRTSLQEFANMEEFEKYSLWLLFSHFGEKVVIEELQLLADLDSRW